MRTQHVADKIAGPLEVWVAYCEAPNDTHVFVSWALKDIVPKILSFINANLPGKMADPGEEHWLEEVARDAANGVLGHESFYRRDTSYWTFHLCKRAVE